MEGLIQNLNMYLQGTVWAAYPVVFLGGLITSFTPCVYPTIPIIVGYIGGKKSTSRISGFFFSCIYVFGLSLTYSALGAISALTGRIFGEIQHNPWTYVIVGNVILIFGLSMLEVFTISLPALSWFGSGRGGRGILGALGLGIASGFITAPCTIPILGVLLAYVGTAQNVFVGFTLLFTYAVGMGVLLIIAGTFTGFLTSLPRSGQWMVIIQRLFGWFMIGLGEFFLIKAGRLWYR